MGVAYANDGTGTLRSYTCEWRGTNAIFCISAVRSNHRDLFAELFCGVASGFAPLWVANVKGERGKERKGRRKGRRRERGRETQRSIKEL